MTTDPLWLVTGGAGYIGAHVVRAFRDAGIVPVVIDDLSSGHREFVPPGVRLVEGDLRDHELVASVLATPGVAGVVHIAGFKYAGVSVEEPLHTYRQNVEATMTLLAAMEQTGVGRIVFSSSAAVYGTPSAAVVTEATPSRPESPYGESKLIGEWLLADQGRARGLRHTSLRYFNVIGSGSPELYDSSPYNLLPRAFRMLIDGETPQINGDDYPTRDGTAVRDYLHVVDLALAHVEAARRLADGAPLEPVYNLGSGTGSSVRELMTAISRATSIPFEPRIAPRRAGDPASIVASGELAARDLGWAMRHTLDEMIASQWEATRRAWGEPAP